MFEIVSVGPSERYSEREKSSAHGSACFKALILPMWFSNQWLTGSLIARANLHFLQCRTRGSQIVFIRKTTAL
jgi:hypothetical protein